MISFRHNMLAYSLISLLTLFSAAPTFAQAVTGTIFGLVTDATGSAVAGAAVQIQNPDTGFSRSERTDQAGRYSSRNLLPGSSYSVTVQQPGFRTEERRGITLSVASEIAVNVELAVGSTQDKVEVVGEAPSIEISNATISKLVSGEQIRDLPLNGRSLDQLAALTPGMFLDKSANPNASLGFGSRISVNGSRVDSILYLLDGMVINDPSGGAPISATQNMLGVEGILEFRMLTHNFSAEYGRVSGGVMSSVTRSGTNQFNGSAYEFVRNNIFDARNFFNPGSLPPFRRNQFGGAIGGPVIKDRLFFFSNYESLRQRQGITINIPVPDANARQGLLPNPSTGQLQPTPLNQAALPFVNLFPLPNGPSNGDGTAQYLTTFNAKANENYYMERMDFRLSDKDSFYGRYVYDPGDRLAPRPVPSFAETSQTASHFAILSETHIFSGTTLNDFRIGFNRVNSASQATTLVAIDPSITLIPGQGLARFRFSGTVGSGGQLPELGTDSGRPQTFPQNTFQETDVFSTVRGAHSLKFGVDVERVQINSNQNSGMVRGTVMFGGLAALLAGTPSNITVILPGGNNHFARGFRRTIYGWFIQDDFRIRSNLTLNLGLRQDIFTTPTEVNGFTGQLVNLTDAQYTPGRPFISPKKTFSPRVGLAWDPTGSGKTSVRLGVGIYYNPIDGRAYYNSSLGGSLWLNTVQVNNPPFPNALANGTQDVLPAVTALQYNLNNPMTINYNFEVQRQLTRTLALRAAYVGSISDHLLRLVSWNTRIPTIQPDGSTLYPASGPLKNPNFASISYLPTDARSNYNGLQTTLQDSLSGGLQFQVSYTWSKALSNADSGIPGISQTTTAATMDPNNLARDYGLSVYDERHRLVINGSYQLPFVKGLKVPVAKAILAGWAVNGIYTYGSGRPLNISDGFNNARDADTNNPDRPNLNPGFSNNPINGVTAGCPGIPAGQKLHTPDRWYDPCAFSLSPAGTFGNLARNTLTGPGTNNVDFTLMKATKITETKKLEFRWELFNMLNHTYFGAPNLSAFSSSRTLNGSAGQITTTLGANRQMQLGLKLIF